MTFIPSAAHFFATLLPTLPTPTTPIDLPSSVILCFLPTESNAATIYSATELALEPGAEAKPMPAFVQVIDIDVLKADCGGGDEFDFAVCEQFFIYRRYAADEQNIRIGDGFRRDLPAG